VSAGPGGPRFLVCRPPREPVAWSPPRPTPETGFDVGYFGSVLEQVSLRLDHPALTFILTWDLRELPVAGDDVVVIVQGDEDGRVPRFAADVLAVFKCYGSFPPRMPARRVTRLELLEAVHLSRRLGIWARDATVAVGRAARSGRAIRRIYPIPLGYYNQKERPIAPAGDRRWLVSFAGSGGATRAGTGLRESLSTPKDLSRRAMLEALAQLRIAMPDAPIASVAIDGFPSLLPGQDAGALQMTETYSDLLADTAICLVPRGNSPETFRFFEALRAGCVVICEPLPRHWFYRGAPVIQIDSWGRLPTTVRELLATPGRLEALQQASIRWWQRKCSEEAVAAYMAQRIRQRRNLAQSRRPVSSRQPRGSRAPSG
jgi:hypothetical protein